MLRRNKENKLPDRTNNIWNRHDFAMCGLGKKNCYLEQYRNECKDDAMDMLKQYFFALWD